jgi:hypothetical protein
MRKDDEYWERAHHEIYLRTGVPNPMILGEIGASKYAYPNGLLSQRIWRWIVRQVRRLARRGTPS